MSAVPTLDELIDNQRHLVATIQTSRHPDHDPDHSRALAVAVDKLCTLETLRVQLPVLNDG